MANLVSRPARSLGFNAAYDWDPFRNFFSGAGGSAGIDVQRTESGGYTVEIPVPGYKPSDIEVTLEDNVLSVSGKTEKRQFSRSLLLPEDIDGDNIEAKVENGLLSLQLNAHPKAQPKKIEVRVGQ